MSTAYYGRPIIKPPTWTDLIPTYFFAGGLAGASAILSLTARSQGNRRLERALDVTTVAALGVSAFCLIKDLGKPMRFVNMLRVIKPTSPMSVGTYIFSAFSASASLGFVADLLGAGVIAVPCKTAAAAIGPLLSTYTAVLICDTAVPAWHEARKSMPAVFAAGSAMSAAGAGLLFGPKRGAMCVNLAILAAAAEVAALRAHHQELGSVQCRAYKTGKAKLYVDWARRLTVAGALLARGNWTPKRRLAGACLMTGALLERFGVMEAGRNSAKDPAYVLAQQTLQL
jgi:formate-dependent nitrite reductase membrane component NrfD